MFLERPSLCLFEVFLKKYSYENTDISNLDTKNIRTKQDKKFITGEPRYCQSCGTESHNLIEVTKESQKINQLQYCQKCAEDYQAEQ